MEKSESIKELASALVAVQKELAPLKRDKENPFFHSSYVGLDTVMPAALALLNKHDLALTQTVGNGGAEGGSTLTTTLMHTSGEWISDTQPLLLVKEDPQGQGSAITYARRYGVMAALGMVAEEDDDGNRASQSRSGPRQPQADRPAPPQPKRDGPIQMKSKREGTCSMCKQPISVGVQIFWDGREAWHVPCQEALDGKRADPVEPEP